MVVIVIQNHCNGEYPEEVTMFDYDFPSEYYWTRHLNFGIFISQTLATFVCSAPLVHRVFYLMRHPNSPPAAKPVGSLATRKTRKATLYGSPTLPVAGNGKNAKGRHRT
jgi:hypothetical protein